MTCIECGRIGEPPSCRALHPERCSANFRACCASSVGAAPHHRSCRGPRLEEFHVPPRWAELRRDDEPPSLGELTHRVLAAVDARELAIEDEEVNPNVAALASRTWGRRH